MNSFLCSVWVLIDLSVCDQKGNKERDVLLRGNVGCLFTKASSENLNNLFFPSLDGKALLEESTFSVSVYCIWHWIRWKVKENEDKIQKHSKAPSLLFYISLL